MVFLIQDTVFFLHIRHAVMSSKLVLIRGLFRGKCHWGDFPDMLRLALPDKQIIAVEIPGSGSLHHQPSPTTIFEMVESIRAQLHLSESVDVLAISMGGMIALKWAEMYPTEVHSVVCINTSFGSVSPFYERLKPQNYIKIVKALCVSGISRELIIWGMVSNQPAKNKIIDQWVKYAEKYPMTVKNFWRQLYASIRFKVQKPACRLLFISSKQDGLVNSRATEAIAKKWQSEVIYNLSDGHDIPLDNPKWLIDTIKKWLNK